MGRSPVDFSEPFGARQLGNLRGVPSFPPALGEDWRIAEEGTRIVARRCQCKVPVLDHEADGEARCVFCGREPTIRLMTSSPSTWQDHPDERHRAGPHRL